MPVIMCDNDIIPPLINLDDLESAFQWACTLRKEYSSNSNIWRLRRDWKSLKHEMLAQLNDRSYQFGLLDRYQFDDAIISLWYSQDMIALKLITQVLGQHMVDHIPKSCYHIKGHGGLKKAVADTYAALPDHQFVLRSDVKSYYESTQIDVLMGIIETYVDHPVLLKLPYKALRRMETRGVLFYEQPQLDTKRTQIPRLRGAQPPPLKKKGEIHGESLELFIS